MKLSPKQVFALMAIGAADPLPYVSSAYVAPGRYARANQLHEASVRALVVRGLVRRITCSDHRVPMADRTTVHLIVLTFSGHARYRWELSHGAER